MSRIKDAISRRLFGVSQETGLIYMNAGKRYIEGAAESTVTCVSCGAKWFPKVAGYSPERRNAEYCPYCGYHR